MKLQLTPDALEIQLSGMERLWSVHLSDRITIPRDRIHQASQERPQTSRRELRAPGTYWPGLIKAGTYYTERGREFWYCQGTDRPTLTLDLDPSEYYKRVVLTLPEDSDISAEQF